MELGVGDLPVGVIRVDRDDRVVEANAAFVEWFGGGDVEGRTISDLLEHAPEDLFPTSDGPGPWMMVHPADPGRAVMVARSSLPDGAVLVVADATQRFAALLDLRRSYSLADRTRTRLELVIDAAIAFGEATTEERLAQILSRTSAEAYRAEDAVVYLTDSSGSVRLAAGSHPFRELIDPDIMAGLAREVREVVTVSSAAEANALSPALARAMADAGVKALIAAPVEHEDESSYGVFACFFLHDRTFDREAAPLAEALASQAAQTLSTLRLQHRLAHAAMHDETTGLPNRRLLEEQIAAAAAGRAGKTAVIFLDLDGFKAVNDTLGHVVGDDVLREVGRRLQVAVREGDMVARYGGDEFVVVCDVTDPAAASEIAERLRSSVEAPYDFLPTGLRLAASVGVALSGDGDGLTIERMVRAADQAMYLAKSEGGNRVSFVTALPRSA